MPNVWQPPDGEYVLGAGRVFLRPYDDAGLPAGQLRYAAETQDLVISIASEEVVLQSVDPATASVLERVRTSITRSGRTSFRQISPHTLRLFFATDGQATHDQGVEASVEENHDVGELGVMIQLGRQTAGAPLWGHRHVAITSIERDSDSEPLVLGTDYSIDAAKGQIKILETSTVLAAATPAVPITVEIIYSVAAYEQDYLATSGDASASRIYEMRFEADNTRGPNRDYWFPRVDLGPEGDLALKSRTEFQQIPVSFMILEPGTIGGIDYQAAYILDESVPDP